ncbi:MULTISPECIES: hypothetical protein [Psychrobacter]|uniref:hypothetical protein n=1 Tax=Psychrobacter TaxID=497 RepID=UPI00191982AA|nr:hypothetical protein [Psychrobacter sp. Pi2-52]
MQKYQETTNDIVSAIKQFTRSIDSSNDYRGDMSSLIQVTSNLKLINLDYWERLIRSELDTNLHFATRSKWQLWFKPNVKLTWLGIVNGDGYKREKSLLALSGGAPNAFFFALVVRRLNDWVPQVRKAAIKILPSLLRSTKPEYVAEVLCMLLLNWHSWGKIEEADNQMFLDMIATEEMALLLKSHLISSTSGPMPSLLSQIGRTDILDNYLDEVASDAVQPYVRSKAYRSLFESRMTWVKGREWQWIDKAYGKRKLIPIIAERKIDVQPPFLELLNRAATDRSPIVRQVSAEFLIRNIEKLGIQSRIFAEKFAADKSANVAEQGKFILRKLDEKALDNNINN